MAWALIDLLDLMPWRRRRIVDVRCQPNFCTANLHLFLSRASLSALISDSHISEQFSWMLFSHFFLGLPLGLVPPICLYMSRPIFSIVPFLTHSHYVTKVGEHSLLYYHLSRLCSACLFSCHFFLWVKHLGFFAQQGHLVNFQLPLVLLF